MTSVKIGTETFDDERVAMMEKELERIDKFFTKVESWDGVLDMGIGRAPATKKKDNICGSPACMGGWLATFYGVARERVGIGKSADYELGAAEFQKRMGFCEERQSDTDAVMNYNICLWAHSNPEYWGNSHGRRQFARAEAYNESNRKYTPSTITLRAFIIKWTAVIARIKMALHNKKKAEGQTAPELSVEGSITLAVEKSFEKIATK